MGPPARIGDPNFPLAHGLQTRFNTGGRGRGTSGSASGATRTTRPFPEIIPPSAESLMEGAPTEVVEAELVRLLGTWSDGLGVLGEVFDNNLASAHRGSGRGNGGANGN